MAKTLKPGTRITRSFTVERSTIDIEKRTVELAFSSETPVDRWWGREILDHSPQSVRLGRLNNGGPLLIDHANSVRSQVGVIESAAIGSDRVGRTQARFGKGAADDEIFQKVADGIVRNVSVGYVIHRAVLEESNDDVDTYRITDWEPFEVSLVPVPADTAVGVGRSAEVSPVIDIADPETHESPVMKIETRSIKETRMDKQDLPEIEIAAIEKRATDAATRRITEILAIGAQFARYGADKMAAEFIPSGKSIDEFRQLVMEKVSTTPLPTSDVGMNEREIKRFSFIRAMHAMANPRDHKAQEAAAYEFECSRAAADKHHRTPQGIMVPSDVLKRELTVGTATAGGDLVATNLMAADFITLLRNAMVLTKLGVRTLAGLVGDLAIPRQTGGATAYWVAEATNITSESDQAFDQVPLTPKTVGAYTDISRKLLLQSSLDVEMMVRVDLAMSLGLAIEAVAINGGGSNQPTGVLATSGIGDVAGGTNGLAPAWSHIVSLETDVAVANAAVGNMGYLTNAKVRGKLKQTFVNATYGDDPIWGTSDVGAAVGDGILNGYNATVTNAVPSNLTKGTSSGVCSAIIFGNWADLIIGMWGGLDITVDPYANALKGSVRIVTLQDVDTAVRHAESFAAMKDALTT